MLDFNLFFDRIDFDKTYRLIYSVDRSESGLPDETPHPVDLEDKVSSYVRFMNVLFVATGIDNNFPVFTGHLYSDLYKFYNLRDMCFVGWQDQIMGLHGATIVHSLAIPYFKQIIPGATITIS